MLYIAVQRSSLLRERMINANPTSSSAKLRIREIEDADIDPVIRLLMRGFPNPRRHWDAGLERLRKRTVPPNTPRYGHLLEADDKTVGVILLISSQRGFGDQKLFSNLSAWYVDPGFRSHATQLLKRALSNKQTTYLSISPAAHVRPIYEALGFTCYSSGQVLTVPGLARDRENARTSIVQIHRLDDSDLEEGERRLIEVQKSYGCIAVCCAIDGQMRPFVFVPRMLKSVIPCAQLAYCRNISDLIDVAGTVGRYLAMRGRPFVLIDANGPFRGLPGKYFPGVSPKYYKGAAAPVIGDLTDTEATIFGFASPVRRLAQTFVKNCHISAQARLQRWFGSKNASHVCL